MAEAAAAAASNPNSVDCRKNGLLMSPPIPEQTVTIGTAVMNFADRKRKGSASGPIGWSKVHAFFTPQNQGSGPLPTPSRLERQAWNVL